MFGKENGENLRVLGNWKGYIESLIFMEGFICVEYIGGCIEFYESLEEI